MNVEEIVSKLSVEEKIALIVGAGFSKTVLGAAGETRAIERLGVPSIVLSDGPAGVRIYPARLGVADTFYTTAFPNEIVLTSTWNLDLVERVGKAIGEEAREYGVDVMLAPAVNMHRIPLCGRIFEYFSEDPVLAGEMAAAYIRGVQSEGVGATIKHFVGNEQEEGRMYINTVISERALREIYLRPFEIAIKKANPWAVMAAYNKLNGLYCTQSPWLLTQVLRREWGYSGLVMTDWWAGDNPVEQVKAGCDLIMPGDDGVVKRLLEAYSNGVLSEEVITERARNVLRLVAMSLKARGYKPSHKPNLEEHAKIAYEAAVEGVVLLKNEAALPIAKNARVALFGRGSYWTIPGGLGSGYTYPRYVVSIADGLKERGVAIDPDVERVYMSTMHRLTFIGHSHRAFRQIREGSLRAGDVGTVEYLLLHLADELISWSETMAIQEDFFTEEFLDRVARGSDVAIVTISRVSTEGFDRVPAQGDLYLRDDEQRLIARVSNAFHKYGKKVVVLLNVPGPIEIASWRDLVDAILVIWLPGQEAGRAVADILLGKASPSGKLPLTWFKDPFEAPAMRTYPGEPRDNPVQVVYYEDIYVGYRYYDTFGVEPAYEFGYGLSYTTFEYRDLAVEKASDSIVVRLTVRNTGKYSGKEVVQVYVKPPVGKLDKPFQELKGFHKTRVLAPGEEEIVSIAIPIEHLASFNGKHWIVEKGQYEVRVGASSRDVRLKATIEIENDMCFDVSWRRTPC
uniref:Glycoside hydrolase family 3 protein n=1 Tax=Ignisphaera aggregans TaxID=334771 RepID=A0A7C4BDN5_9CREN